jgi:hypothetical protein
MTYHCRPKPELTEVNAGGAFINCYIESSNIENAKKIARIKIEEYNWSVLSLDDAYEISKETISKDGLKYFEQALIDKTVFVFHTYPKEK